MRATQTFLRRAHASPFLVLAVVSISACSSPAQSDDAEVILAADAAPADAAATDAAPTVFVPCPGAIEPGPTGLVGADVIRQGTAGMIEVTVAFCNPLIPDPPNELLFYVILEDHLGLAASDVTNGTSVTTGANLYTDGPITWDGDDLSVSGEHHAKGHLHAPDHSSDGTPLLGPDTMYLELTLGGIGDNGSIVLRWEEEYLP